MNTWVGKFLYKVDFGHVIVTGGKVKPNPYRIIFDLAESSTLTKNLLSTIILRIEVNFRENQIVRRMYHSQNGWCQEDISNNWTNQTLKNPLKPGQIFEFRVAVLQKNFEIYINDSLYGTYNYLEKLEKINYVVLMGDFEKIQHFHHRMLFPQEFPLKILNSGECFSSDVPQKYEIGTIIVLKAIVRGPPSSEFSICFLCSEMNRVLMKFSVDFFRKTIIRIYQSENLEYIKNDEETSGEFVFKRGKIFTLAFGFGEYGIHIAINEKLYTVFNYPLKIFSISTIKCFNTNEAELSILNLDYYNDLPTLPYFTKLFK